MGAILQVRAKKGACRGHEGVKEWYAAAASAGKGVPQTEAAAPAQGSAPGTATPVPAAHQSEPTSHQQQATTSVAPGGGAGQVWLNTSTNVYHCSGSRYYGKTKAGAYMTEADAKAKGARADHGKECSAQ